MSIWSNLLAPELFRNFDDWYDNYIECVNREPSEEAVQNAKDYFSNLSFDRTVKGILGVES